MITASMISSRVKANTHVSLRPGSAGCRVARASRVLTLASRQRGLFERLFRRDAETNTRDACATRQPALPGIDFRLLCLVRLPWGGFDFHHPVRQNLTHPCVIRTQGTRVHAIIDRAPKRDDSNGKDK